MYSRTTNESGRVTSRCLYCFMTVESEARAAEELDRIEAAHLCPEKALAQQLARTQWSMGQQDLPRK
jgi:hypothetical protein